MLNLVQTIVSQTTFYIVSFNFLCSAVQKFHFGRTIWGAGVCPPENPQIWSNHCLTILQLRTLWVATFYVEQFTNNFLHCKFQLSMYSSSKISLWEGHLWGVGVCSPQEDS